MTRSALASTFGGIVRPDLLRRIQIDDQLELLRLLHGKFSRLRSLQDSVHIGGYAPVDVHEVRPIGHEPASIYTFAVAVH